MWLVGNKSCLWTPRSGVRSWRNQPRLFLRIELISLWKLVWTFDGNLSYRAVRNDHPISWPMVECWACNFVSWESLHLCQLIYCKPLLRKSSPLPTNILQASNRYAHMSRMISTSTTSSASERAHNSLLGWSKTLALCIFSSQKRQVAMV